MQRELREEKGVTVLLYDQTCAAEKRRRRKRGKFPDAAKRVVINELVCEGCGDCGVQSNCVSVAPVETEFGRKRTIDQSSCNKDYSCIKGFCPSFVTVEGGSLRKPKKAAGEDFSQLPLPICPTTEEPYGVLVTGIGGTGVVTIGALLGMAAHLEGKGSSVLDMTGLAQKNGAVVSHVRIADKPESLYATRIAAGEARLVLACDILTGVGYEALAKMQKGVPRHVPAKVLQVSDIPRTKSGKIVELAVRNVVHGRDVLGPLRHRGDETRARGGDTRKRTSIPAAAAALPQCLPLRSGQ